MVFYFYFFFFFRLFLFFFLFLFTLLFVIFTFSIFYKFVSKVLFYFWVFFEVSRESTSTSDGDPVKVKGEVSVEVGTVDDAYGDTVSIGEDSEKDVPCTRTEEYLIGFVKWDKTEFFFY